MKLLKLLTLVSVFLTAAHLNYAQIRIGGIKIPEINIPTKGTKKPEPKPENTQTNSNSENSTTTKSGSNDETENWLNIHVFDINEAKEEVDSYTPEGKIYLVKTPLQKWLVNAVSLKAREDWAKEKKVSDWLKSHPGNKFEAALDALAASAAKKLPNYIPNANNFAVKDAAMEQMMKAKLKNSATLKISKIGMFHSIWQIEKNDLGMPKNRYREGFIWAKDSTDDHSYCHLYGFVVQQDYAGGGTYGQTFAYLNTDTLFGCPAK